MLEEKKIAVWRLHDYWHTIAPDGIRYGVLKKAGWLPYSPKVDLVFKIPPVSLANLAAHLKKQLNISHIRVVGN
ncbi:hypothetical protein LWS67_24135, partial [Bacillus atrophaeus]|nr:hypothetical protein [Bacillus atrophaeus]